MKIKHMKGFKYVQGGSFLSQKTTTTNMLASDNLHRSGRLHGGLHAHPSIPGQFYYVVGSSVLAVFEVRTCNTRLGCKDTTQEQLSC